MREAMSRSIWKGLAVVGIFAATVVPMAQPASQAQRAGADPKPEQPYATAHFQCNIGSFRILDGEGRVEVNFRGTVLISKLEGDAVPSGNLRKEYEAHDRIIYTGQGKLVVTGKWRAVQWFGRDMTAVWYGRGIARVVGEFDRNMQTGRYWYDKPEEWMPFQATGITNVFLPPLSMGYDQSVTPVRRMRKIVIPDGL